jgi:hypothetical protein
MNGGKAMTDISIMRSKAMTLGNRLAARMGNRRAAFVEAWAIVKAGGVTLPVRGVSFGNRQEAIRRLAAYDPASIRAWIAPEPDNPYDRNAYAVWVMVNWGRGAYRLGYIPREQTGIAAALWGRRPTLTLLDGDIRGAKVRLAV